MKRDHHHITPQPDPPPSMAVGKSKLWEESGELESGNGMDELLADLGYKVKTSDMAEVALKLEQLEEFMMGHQVLDNYSISNLVSETVHYNPSNLDTWLGSMLTGFHSLPPLPPSTTSSHVNHSNHLSQNLDGRVLFEDPSPSSSVNTAADVVISPNNKRLKSIPSVTGGGSATLSVVLVDSQENGIQLVHALMACAEAVQRNDLSLADALMKRIGFLAGSQAGAMGKVAKFFAEGLARRIYRICPENGIDHDSVPDLLQMHFYESCPYLKFAHFTANQAIREAFEGKKSVHVIDFSINQGVQWPVLIQALASRPGGPPAFRLTGVGPPARDDSDYLQDVGRRLSQFATAINVKFEYRGIVAGSLAELDASMLELRPSDVESVVVNSVFEAHKLLALPGAMEKVLSVVKEIKPEIMTIVEQEANHNGPVFVDRFNESLHYYSTLFDSLEGSVDNQNKMMSEVYLGKQICDVVACEGPDRVERHEPLNQWRERFLAAGFEPVHLGSNAYKQASMLLAFFEGGDGYRVVENDGALMLGWHTRPLIASSAWKPNGQRNHHNHHHHHHHHQHTP